MTEYDYRKIFPRMPEKVTIGDITVRDGFQHLEQFISTRAKIFYAEELIFAGCRNIEVTNLGNPYLMPQFSDAEEILAHLRSDRFKKRCDGKGINYDDLCITAVTIREKSVDRAIQLKEQGVGPDRCLMMVSTEEEHHFANSGTTLPDYWAEAERCIKKCTDAGLKMCGTVSTIWGSPIAGATELRDAVEFTKRWLEIGASDIEHADHDGSASAPDVYRYFAMILDEIPDTSLHIAHFHETKRVASASVLAALQAGITHFEATIGGMGGQPANSWTIARCRAPGNIIMKIHGMSA
jgi:hydroxymethylglutaryl-CoA lyase